MAHLFNESGLPPLARRGGRRTLLIVLVALLVFAVSAAVLWYTFSRGNLSPVSFAGPTQEASEKTVSLKDFQVFQQQFTRSMQSTEQLLAAQGAEIKRLSDQLALLSGKLDLLQGPTASVDDAVPLPAPPETARPKKTKSARKPAGKPAGAISTGGAPLSAPQR